MGSTILVLTDYVAELPLSREYFWMFFTALFTLYVFSLRHFFFTILTNLVEIEADAIIQPSVK